MVRRSTETLAALIHDDFVYVNASGTRFDKIAYVETYCTSGRVVFLEQQIEDLPLVRPVPADHRISLLEHLTDKVYGRVIDAAVNTRLTDTE